MTTAATADAPLTAPANPAAAGVATAPCAEERRIADERCEVTARARDRADAAGDAIHKAQRSYDTHETAAAAAMDIADPRVVQAAKEAGRTKPLSRNSSRTRPSPLTNISRVAPAI